MSRFRYVWVRVRVYDRHIRIRLPTLACGQLNRDEMFFFSPRSRLIIDNLVSRDRFGRPVPRQSR